MKLYIAIKEQVPDFIVPTLVAHTILNADNYFKANDNYIDWKTNSFKKVVISVNEKEWNKIKECVEDFWEGHENKTLGGLPSCLIPCPTKEIPNVLKFAKMWKPK